MVSGKKLGNQCVSHGFTKETSQSVCNQGGVIKQTETFREVENGFKKQYTIYMNIVIHNKVCFHNFIPNSLG